MGLFKRKNNLNSKSMMVKLLRDNVSLLNENRRLRNLCNEKDSFFAELASDGLRHGSKLAAKHMADRKYYLRHKNK